MQHKESTILTLMASDFQYAYLKHTIDGFINESYKNHKMQLRLFLYQRVTTVPCPISANEN